MLTYRGATGHAGEIAALAGGPSHPLSMYDQRPVRRPWPLHEVFGFAPPIGGREAALSLGLIVEALPYIMWSE